MLWLIVGLCVFLGVHSINLFFQAQRLEFINSRGDAAFKGLYTIASLLGFVLIVWGYGQTRLDPVFIWHPPLALYSVTFILTLLAFLFLTAVNVPNNHLKKIVGHPMIIAVKLWAFGHLLVNGRLGDIVLFSAFLVWAIVYYAINRRRDREFGKAVVAANLGATAITVVIGCIIWALFAFWAHRWLIGVTPFGV